MPPLLLKLIWLYGGYLQKKKVKRCFSYKFHLIYGNKKPAQAGFLIYRMSTGGGQANKVP